MRPQSGLAHESEHVAAFEQTKLVPVDMVRDRTRAPVANVSTGRWRVPMNRDCPAPESDIAPLRA
jgi:hypothetical protein